MGFVSLEAAADSGGDAHSVPVPAVVDALRQAAGSVEVVAIALAALAPVPRLAEAILAIAKRIFLYKGKYTYIRVYIL